MKKTVVAHWFFLNLKLALSKTIRLSKAAFSPLEVVLNFLFAALINGAACSAVRHSFAVGDLGSQVAELGAILRIWATDMSHDSDVSREISGWVVAVEKSVMKTIDDVRSIPGVNLGVRKVAKDGFSGCCEGREWIDERSLGPPWLGIACFYSACTMDVVGEMGMPSQTNITFRTSFFCCLFQPFIQGSHRTRSS